MDYSVIGKILVSMIRKEIETKIGSYEVSVTDFHIGYESRIGINIVRNKGTSEQKSYGFSFEFNTFHKEIERAKRFLTK